MLKGILHILWKQQSAEDETLAHSQQTQISYSVDIMNIPKKRFDKELSAFVQFMKTHIRRCCVLQNNMPEI